jgi:hypothetical protein
MNAMPPVPDDPRGRLTAIVAELADRLPREYAALLAMSRFADERAALARLRDPAWLAQAVAACKPAEADRLADLAARRWATLATPGEA